MKDEFWRFNILKIAYPAVAYCFVYWAIAGSDGGSLGSFLLFAVLFSPMSFVVGLAVLAASYKIADCLFSVAPERDTPIWQTLLSTAILFAALWLAAHVLFGGTNYR